MIKKEIKVEFFVRKDDYKIAFNYMDLLKGSGKDSIYQVEEFEKSITFKSFKNNGKLSKSERTKLAGFFSKADCELIYKAAEDKLVEQLKIESETEKDTARALKLAKVVNDAAREMNFAPIIEVDSTTENFEPDSDGMVTIKEKSSHSSWYQTDGGFGHAPSLYLTRVPKIVGKEARELQDIRRKHQGDETFDFWKTSYSNQEVRIADHENC